MPREAPARLAFALLAALGLLPLLPLPEALRALVAPSALFGGASLALTLGNPFPTATKRLSRPLLQASVVLLGVSVDLGVVARAGRDGLVFSLLSIAAVFALGAVLRRALNVRPGVALLVSAGTAICGGSAIAAVATVVEAGDEDVSVAAATVFLLNALALLLFPPLGRLLGLSQEAFGTWAGIAVHDVASVVGAGTAYGPRALEVATAVKLARVLYLVPVVLLLALAERRSAANRDPSPADPCRGVGPAPRGPAPGGAAPERRPARGSGAKPPPLPWFVGGFLAASAARSLLPGVAALAPSVKAVAGAGFALSLLLVGLGLSREALRAVGGRPLLLGAALWLATSTAALLAVR